LPILVLDNGDLNEVSWEQRELEGDPRFSQSQQVSSIPYAEYAQLLGLDGCKVDSADQVADAWDCALVAERPFVIHAVVDPASPLLPPRLEEAAQQRLLAALDAEGTETARRAREFVVDELHEQEELLAKLSIG
jgi:pyruvate dehydrogenase (quinone)